MKLELFLPYFYLGYGVIGWPVMGTLKAIRDAGFNGVEILLTENVRKNLSHFKGAVKNHGLDVHWHECWTLDDCPIMINKVLDLLGQLPSPSLPISEKVPVDEPLVVYANRWGEVSHRPNCWLQTTAAPQPMGREGFRFSYSDFLREIVSRSLPVVFDTQHYIEYRLGFYGAEKFDLNSSRVLDYLIDGWRKLGSLVKEIHLADTDPVRGRNMGHNVFLGDGIIPLRQFLYEAVKPSGWEGTIVPEVLPQHLRGRLVDLRKQVEKMFE